MHAIHCLCSVQIASWLRWTDLFPLSPGSDRGFLPGGGLPEPTKVLETRSTRSKSRMRSGPSVGVTSLYSPS